jgi:hypothetical protein
MFAVRDASSTIREAPIALMFRYAEWGTGERGR